MAGWLGSAAAGPINQMGTAAEPFVWGKGGRRMSPEQIALERQLAEQQLASGADYSPLQHWTQGLARMSQGLIGGMRLADTRKASEANAQAGDMIAHALAAGGGSDVVAAALMDPATPKPVRDFAELRYRTENRAKPQPSEFERALEASGTLPGTPEWTAAMVKRRDNMLDPLMVIPTPNGPLVTPRSQALLGGGDPASSAPGGMTPPATLPPDFDFDDGGPAATPGTFRP